jgi:hypothetical protein
MSFQVHALAAVKFESLFSLSGAELARIRARRMIVDSKPGYPCRVSLVDADVGETVILLNFEHQPGDSPYRSSHAIFVREHARQAFPDPGTVPEVLASRLISIRAFDEEHDMRYAEIVEGSSLSQAIPEVLQDPAVTYLHLHNAKRGCYAASVTRS